jgi:hypothetical protein
MEEKEIKTFLENEEENTSDISLQKFEKNKATFSFGGFEFIITEKEKNIFVKFIK